MITLPVMMMMMTMMVMMKTKLKKNNLMHTKNPKYNTIHYKTIWIVMASKCLALEFLNTYHLALHKRAIQGNIFSYLSMKIHCGMH